MIYLRKMSDGESRKASTNDDDMARQLEEMGYTRLTKTQVFWYKAVLNAVLEYALPLTAGYLMFSLLLALTVMGATGSFILAWIGSYIAAGLRSALKIWS